MKGFSQSALTEDQRQNLFLFFLARYCDLGHKTPSVHRTQGFGQSNKMDFITQIHLNFSDLPCQYSSCFSSLTNTLPHNCHISSYSTCIYFFHIYLLYICATWSSECLYPIYIRMSISISSNSEWHFWKLTNFKFPWAADVKNPSVITAKCVYSGWLVWLFWPLIRRRYFFKLH